MAKIDSICIDLIDMGIIPSIADNYLIVKYETNEVASNEVLGLIERHIGGFKTSALSIEMVAVKRLKLKSIGLTIPFRHRKFLKLLSANWLKKSPLITNWKIYMWKISSLPRFILLSDIMSQERAFPLLLLSQVFRLLHWRFATKYVKRSILYWIIQRIILPVKVRFIIILALLLREGDLYL